MVCSNHIAVLGLCVQLRCYVLLSCYSVLLSVRVCMYDGGVDVLLLLCACLFFFFVFV